MPIDFDEIIDEYMVSVNPERKRVVGEYYLSELGGCLLSLYYRYTEPKPQPLDRLRIFAAGNLVHEFAAKVFKTRMNSHESERSITIPDPETGLRLRGRLDDFFILGDEKIVVEVKSIKSFAYLDEPKPEHVMQLMPYLLSVGVDRGYLLYFEKNTLETKAFEVLYNGEIFNKLMARARIVHHSLLETSILHRPKPDYLEDPSKKWLCKYCDYAQECPLSLADPETNEQVSEQINRIECLK
jgi:CRISPR/Cas system-associated exonuclease Cas4 (RecB family)